MDPNNQNQVKVFTLEEANALLPKLTAMIRDLQGKREKILSLEVEIDALEIVTEKDDGGASPVMSKKVDEYTRTMAAFYGLVDGVHETGCFLKDLDLGLIDFYAMQNKRGVFLCWKLGEMKISHWHDVDKGFASREKIS